MSETTTAPAGVATTVAVDMFPPLLRERLEKYRIIMPEVALAFDRIMVWPLDDKDQMEKIGEIFVPQAAKEKFGSQRGVLLKAGPRAWDELYSAGIELGHVVITTRLSPWERAYATPIGIQRVLTLRASEVIGSEDLEQAFMDGRMSIVRDAHGVHAIDDRPRILPPTHDEGI